MMNMLMAIVPRDEVESVLQALVAAGHTATFVEGRGGVMRQAKKMLFIAVQNADLENVLTIIRDSLHCQTPLPYSDTQGESSSEPASAAPGMGGTVVFVWELQRAEIY